MNQSHAATVKAHPRWGAYFVCDCGVIFPAARLPIGIDSPLWEAHVKQEREKEVQPSGR